MRLETIYNLRAIPQIQAFTAATARLWGATDREAAELEYAVEEAAGHIIANFPGDENGVFEIICETEPNQNLLRIIMHNRGLPVDTDNIPEYTLENPEGSIDGLRFFLIEKFTDNFFFRNCGHEGWNSILEKRIERLNVPGTSDEPDGAAPQDTPVPKGRATVEFANPEDAYEITKLAYFTYRYSYTKTIIYYPEMLKEAIEHGNVISFVARNEADAIIAHGAYIRSNRCREIGEVGALMSSPEYRKSMVMIKLIKQLAQYPRKSGIDIQIFYSNLVTSHTGSQRITQLFDFSPVALRISVHEQAKFIDITNTSSSQRETLLYALWVPVGCDTEPRLYVPPEHMLHIKDSTERLPFSIQVSDEPTAETAPQTHLSIRRNNENSLATLCLTDFGGDWLSTLKKRIRELCIEGFATLHLELAAHKKLPRGLNTALSEAGFFFSGFFPDTLERWMLLYTYLNNQALDFSQINVHGKQAARLRDYIETCYQTSEVIS